MRSLLVVALAIAALVPIAAQGPLPRANETEAEGRLRLLRGYKIYRGAREPKFIIAEWTEAAERHVPGEPDEPAVQISGWTGDELDFLLKQSLFLLTATERERFDLHLPSQNRVVALLRRGALLHADIALQVRPDPWSPAISLQTSPKRYYIVQHSDGRAEGGFGSGVHLEIGRALLAFLTYAGFGDPSLESLWYRATAASLVQAGEYGYAEPQIGVGLEALPRDARLLFYAGALHEAFAAPRTQRGIERSNVPPGYVSSVGSARQELQRAETLLRRSLEVDRDDLEVRLHHGRVLGQLERHAEAAAELALVDGKLKDPELAYYAALFRGQEEAELDHRAIARDAFERAATLFPSAQSPLMALSRLARRYGDRPGAVRAVHRLFTLPTEESERTDPWWRYDISHVRDADALMKTLYDRFAAEETP